MAKVYQNVSAKANVMSMGEWLKVGKLLLGGGDAEKLIDLCREEEIPVHRIIKKLGISRQSFYEKYPIKKPGQEKK